MVYAFSAFHASTDSYHCTNPYVLRIYLPTCWCLSSFIRLQSFSITSQGENVTLCACNSFRENSIWTCFNTYLTVVYSNIISSGWSHWSTRQIWCWGVGVMRTIVGLRGNFSTCCWAWWGSLGGVYAGADKERVVYARQDGAGSDGRENPADSARLAREVVYV